MKSFPDDDTLTTSPKPARPEPRAEAAPRPTQSHRVSAEDAGAAGEAGAPGFAGLPQQPFGPSQPATLPRLGVRAVVWLLLVVLALGAAIGWYYGSRWQPQQAARPAVVATATDGRAKGGAAAPAGAAGAPAARIGGGRAAPGVPRVPVVAVQAQSGNVPIVLDALGTVAPAQTVAVRSRVAGLLERVLFKEGEFVEEGQLLAEIDPRELRVQLAQAEGQLARDRALLENARLDLKRYETLFKQDSIARQQVDTQRALVRQYQGLIQVDQSQVDHARLQLSHARVTAPISGRTGLRQVDAGNMVTGNEPEGLVVITQVEPISVVFSLPQDALPQVIKRISSGEQLPVKAFDRTQQNLLATGTLVSLDNLIDPATGTIKLKAEFANRDGQLFPNQFVNARLELDTLRNVVTVPSSAVQRGSQGMFVYLVNPDRTVALRPVTLGPAHGQRSTVTSGVAAGELVVVDGTDRLREGAAVELIDRP